MTKSAGGRGRVAQTCGIGAPGPGELEALGPRCTLFGGAGDDTFYGGRSTHVFIGGPGRDHAFGGAGNHAFDFEDHQRDTIDGGGGTDVMEIDDGYDLARDIEITI